MNRLQKRISAQQQLSNRRLLAKGGRLTDTTKYLVVDISNASGIFPLMTTNTKKIVGITNFDGNKLNAGRHLVIDAVKVEVATGGKSPETAIFNGKTQIPESLTNCEFRVEQKGLVPVDIPLKELSTLDADGQSVKARDFSTAPVLVANEEINMVIQFPNGVKAPEGCFIRISFDCHQVKFEN